MARDVDFSTIEVPEYEDYQGSHGGLQSPFSFDHMRRKAYIAKKDE